MYTAKKKRTKEEREEEIYTIILYEKKICGTTIEYYLIRIAGSSATGAQ